MTPEPLVSPESPRQAIEGIVADKTLAGQGEMPEDEMAGRVLFKVNWLRQTGALQDPDIADLAADVAKDPAVYRFLIRRMDDNLAMMEGGPDPLIENAIRGDLDLADAMRMGNNPGISPLLDYARNQLLAHPATPAAFGSEEPSSPVSATQPPTSVGRRPHDVPAEQSASDPRQRFEERPFTRADMETYYQIWGSYNPDATVTHYLMEKGVHVTNQDFMRESRDINIFVIRLKKMGVAPERAEEVCSDLVQMVLTEKLGKEPSPNWQVNEETRQAFQREALKVINGEVNNGPGFAHITDKGLAIGKLWSFVHAEDLFKKLGLDPSVVTAQDLAMALTTAYSRLTEFKNRVDPDSIDGRAKAIREDQVLAEEQREEADLVVVSKGTAPVWMDPKVQPVVKIEPDAEILGFGAISQTYPAELTIPGYPPVMVAVKLPSQDMGGGFKTPPTETAEETRRQMVLDENILLRMFRNRHHQLFPNSPSPFPFSRLTYLNETPLKQPFPDKFEGQPALILELMRRENSLYTLNRSSSSPIKDFFDEHPGAIKRALTAYLEAVATTHSLGLAPTDRKYGDLFFFPENGRLVVLDWNVVKPMNKETHDQLRHLRSVTDISQSEYKELTTRGIKVGLYMFTEPNLTGKYWTQESLQKLADLKERLDKDKDYQPTVMEIMQIVKGLSVKKPEELI